MHSDPHNYVLLVRVVKEGIYLIDNNSRFPLTCLKHTCHNCNNNMSDILAETCRPILLFVFSAFTMSNCLTFSNVFEF